MIRSDFIWDYDVKRNQQRRRQIKALQRAVEEILFREWDPIGVNDLLACRDEYDSYAATITRMLCEGADEHKLVQYLGQFQWNGIGGSRIDEERDQRVARLLRQLVHSD